MTWSQLRACNAAGISRERLSRLAFVWDYHADTTAATSRATRALCGARQVFSVAAIGGVLGLERSAVRSERGALLLGQVLVRVVIDIICGSLPKPFNTRTQCGVWFVIFDIGVVLSGYKSSLPGGVFKFDCKYVQYLTDELVHCFFDG